MTKDELMQCPHQHQQRRDDVAEPPKFMQHLPVFRGFPVPWFVDYVNGEPEFRAMDRRKFRAAIRDRLCWVCGNPLFVENVFVIGPMCSVNLISSEPPSHRECAIYSATTCPFLSRPHMVRRKDGLIDVKHSPGIMHPRNPGATLLWYTRRYDLIESPYRPEVKAVAGTLFRLGRPFKTAWYCRGRTATRGEVLESFESGVLLLRETAEKLDGPAGVAFLEREVDVARRLIPR